MTRYNKNYNNGMSTTKNTLKDKPNNVQVTLTGPVNREQLLKIQEVLRHPSQYKLPPNEQPATGEYAKLLNKFCPKKVEVEATVDEIVGFGHFMRKSDAEVAEVAEAIDIYKALGDNISYRPEDQSTEPPQQD